MNENLKQLVELDYKTKVQIYSNFLRKQSPNFIKYLNYINSVLCILKEYGIIADCTELSARIKSHDSAIKNDAKKALNDIYGIEIHFATPDEEIFVLELLRSTINNTKEVVHNKDNGYVSHHYSGFPRINNSLSKRFEDIFSNTYDCNQLYDSYMARLSESKKEKMSKQEKDRIRSYFEKFVTHLGMQLQNLKNNISQDDIESAKEELQLLETGLINEPYNGTENNEELFPIIEFQFKTIAVAREATFGRASHEIYKNEDLDELQAQYDKNGGFPETSLPIMFKSNLEVDENGKPIPPRMLSKEEIIKIQHPSVKLRRAGRENKTNESNVEKEDQLEM